MGETLTAGVERRGKIELLIKDYATFMNITITKWLFEGQNLISLIPP